MSTTSIDSYKNQVTLGPTDWDIISQLNKARAPSGVTVEFVSLNYKGVSFRVRKDLAELLAPEFKYKVHPDEMAMMEALYPHEFNDLKRTWKKAWIEAQAEKAFYLEE